MSKLLHIVLLVPVVITLSALFVQGYFLCCRVLLPLQTFDETAHLRELSVVIGGQLRGSQLHSAPTFAQRRVYTKYLINIVLIAGGDGATSHQRKVVTSIRKHLVRTLNTIQIAPSLTFQVRQSAQIDEQLNNLIQYTQVSHNDSIRPIPFLLQSDIMKFAASPDSAFHSTAGAMSGCEESSGCKELTFAYYVPDFSHQEDQLHDDTQNGKGAGNSHFARLRIVTDPNEVMMRVSEEHTTASNTPLMDADSNSALILPNRGCFSVLRLENTTHYDPVDAVAIYTATTYTIQCLRGLLNITYTDNSRKGSQSVDTTESDNANTANTAPHTIIAADPALTISPTDVSHYHHAHLLSMLHSTLHKLNTLVQLHNYREDVLALFTMSSRQRSAYREIFDILGQIRQNSASSGADGAYCAVDGVNVGCRSNECSCDIGSGGDGGDTSTTCRSGTVLLQQCTSTTPHSTIHTLSTLLHTAHTLVLDLETDPEGGLQAPPPIEQYFAIFGPYWLPVMVPVFRAVKSMFVGV